MNGGDERAKGTQPVLIAGLSPLGLWGFPRVMFEVFGAWLPGAMVGGMVGGSSHIIALNTNGLSV